MPNRISPEEFYDGFATDYDDTVNGSIVDAQNIKEAVKVFHKYNRDTSGSVLDLGCGTGLLKDQLHGNFDYTGIDVSNNMLDCASKRSYKIIHKSVEDALPEIPDSSYDFVFALSSLQFIKDIYSCLTHIKRVARRSIILSIDDLTENFLHKSKMECYNHSRVVIENAQEDYFIRGWISPTMGIVIQSRIVYIEKNQN